MSSSAKWILLGLDLLDAGLRSDTIKAAIAEQEAAGATDEEIEAYLTDLKAKARQEAVDAANTQDPSGDP